MGTAWDHPPTDRMGHETGWQPKAGKGGGALLVKWSLGGELFFLENPEAMDGRRLPANKITGPQGEAHYIVSATCKTAAYGGE